MLSNNPSVSFAYTGEPTAAAGLLNGKSLYGTTRLAGGFRFTRKADEKSKELSSAFNLARISLFYICTCKSLKKVI